MESEKINSQKMKEFLDRLDELCWEFGFEIWPTETVNYFDRNGKRPTFTVHGDGEEKVNLLYIDGDGRGK